MLLLKWGAFKRLLLCADESFNGQFKAGGKKCSSSMLPNDISMGEQGHAAEGEFLVLVCVVLPIKMLNIHFMDSFAVEKTKQPRIIVSAPLFTTRARSAVAALGLSPVFLSIKLSCYNA